MTAVCRLWGCRVIIQAVVINCGVWGPVHEHNRPATSVSPLASESSPTPVFIKFCGGNNSTPSVLSIVSTGGLVLGSDETKDGASSSVSSNARIL